MSIPSLSATPPDSLKPGLLLPVLLRQLLNPLHSNPLRPKPTATAVCLLAALLTTATLRGGAADLAAALLRHVTAGCATNAAAECSAAAVAAALTHAGPAVHERLWAALLATESGGAVPSAYVALLKVAWEAGTAVALPEDQHAVLLATLCACLLYTSPSPRDRTRSRMPSSA